MQADGAQGHFGVTPDLTTFGKIIGAGMPVGAYGGRREIMEMVSPVGAVYQAGTLSGNPVAMAAGIAQLTYLKEHPEVYTKLNKTSDSFFAELQKIVDESGRGYQVNHICSLGSMFCTTQEVYDYETAKTSDTKVYADYCNYMQNHGIYLARRSLRQCLSLRHIRRNNWHRHWRQHVIILKTTDKTGYRLT